MFYRVVRIIVDVTLFVLLGGDVWGQMFLKGEASPAMVKLWREARGGDRLECGRTRFAHYLAFCRCLSAVRFSVICGAVIGLIVWVAVPQLVGLALSFPSAAIIITWVSVFKHFDLFRSFYPGIGRDFRRLWQSVAGEFELNLEQISSLGEKELKERTIKRLEETINHCRISPGSVWRYEELKSLLASVGLISSSEDDELWRGTMEQASTLRAAC